MSVGLTDLYTYIRCEINWQIVRRHLHIKRKSAWDSPVRLGQMRH